MNEQSQCAETETETETETVVLRISVPDHAFRESLSPIARKACAIVDKIRRDEKDTIWTPDLEEHLAQREKDVTIHAGMMCTPRLRHAPGALSGRVRG